MGCQPDDRDIGGIISGGDSGDVDSTTSGAGAEAEISSDGGTGDATGASDVKLDLGNPGFGGCGVGDDLDGVGTCDKKAPPDSFEPVEEWTFSSPAVPWAGGWTPPLVANMTDDNGDGFIDLCDTPDVILATAEVATGGGSIYVLDGATGSLHFIVPVAVYGYFTPALGDVDGDGLVEIVTIDPEGSIMVIEHDGQLKWTRETQWGTSATNLGQSIYYASAAALADLDNDGDVEIVIANKIVDHAGESELNLPQLPGSWSATVPADLDDDGDLEIVLGSAAFHHDGELAWTTSLTPGFPQIGDVDRDGRPEVVLTSPDGVALIEHDGTVTYAERRTTGVTAGAREWNRPAVIKDMDSDGSVEFAVSSGSVFAVYDATDASVRWDAPVLDSSGVSGSTAFDFLGDGVSEAIYSDEYFLYAFDQAGNELFGLARQSGTLTEYPVVADVDNDGSAEILFVSNDTDYPLLQVYGDIDSRWIQARRIWNQHAYHVTNVREDGTIPRFQEPNWKTLNTFRVNAQIEDGGVCVPPAG